MKDKDLNIDIDIDMKIYQISALSYVFRLCDKAKVIREKIAIAYSKDEAAKKATEILRLWMKDKENERAARL